jgi:ABC-type phosphate/phosphonate transport system substrate-binding protein
MIGLGPVTGASAQSPELVLAVQPILSEAETKTAFTPLADYLSRAAGRAVRLRVFPNFFAYWSETLAGNDKHDLAMDAAHIADYRVRKHQFHVVAKQPDTVSYSLIVQEGAPFMDAADLVGKKVATLGIPSMETMRMDALFPNPARQPVLVASTHSGESVDMVRGGKAAGAMVPTRIVSREMGGKGGISVVATTDAVPAPAVSVNPRMPADLREKIRSGLLDAKNSEAGRQMLQKIGFMEFEPASGDTYKGYADLLKNVGF